MSRNHFDTWVGQGSGHSIDPAKVASDLTGIETDIANAALGFRQKGPVRAATVGDVALSGAYTVDGITLVDGDRYLALEQTDATQNGAYLYNSSGAHTRAEDADADADLSGAVFHVDEGATHAGKAYRVLGEPVLGVDDVELRPYEVVARNMTGSEVAEKYEAEDNRNQFTDEEKAKLASLNPSALAPVDGAALTGVPTAPKAPAGTDSDQIASTGFVLENSPRKAELKRAEYGDALKGGRLQDWTSDRTGEPEDVGEITGASSVVDARYGPVLQVDGSLIVSEDHLYIADRRVWPMRDGVKYRDTWRFIRTGDPSDPAGASIQIMLKNLDEDKAHFSDLTHDTITPLVADGLQEVSYTVSQTGALGPDVNVNPNVSFQRACLKFFGAEAQNVLRVIDFQRVALPDPDQFLGDMGVAPGATTNSDDEVLLDRSNHTGVQSIETVDGLQTVLDRLDRSRSGAAATTVWDVELTSDNVATPGGGLALGWSSLTDDDGEAYLQFDQFENATSVLVETIVPFTDLSPNTTYQIAINAEMIEASALGTGHINLRLETVDSGGDTLDTIPTLAVSLSDTAGWVFSDSFEVGDTPPHGVNIGIVARSDYTDSSARLLVLKLQLRNLTDVLDVATEFSELNTAQASVVARVTTAEDVLQGLAQVSKPSLETLTDFAGQVVGGPNSGSDPDPVFTATTDAGTPIIRMSGEGMGEDAFKTLAERNLIEAVEGDVVTFYVKARISGVTGTSNQLYLQLAEIDSEANGFALGPLHSAAAQLTDTEQLFSFSHTVGAGDLPWLRANVYKDNDFQEPLAVIDVSEWFVVNEGAYARTQQRLAELWDNRTTSAAGETGPSRRALIEASSGPTPWMNVTSARNALRTSAASLTLSCGAPDFYLWQESGHTDYNISDMVFRSRSTVEVPDGATATFYRQDGDLYGLSDPALHVTGPAVVEATCMRFPTARAIVGNATPQAAVPAVVRSIIELGQSNSVGFATQGGNFAIDFGLGDEDLMTYGTLDLSMRGFSYGTGGTAVTYQGRGANGKYFINPADINDEGPEFLDYKARSQADRDAGHPVAEIIILRALENDARALDDGDLTYTELRDGIVMLCNKVRDHQIALGASDPQIIISMLGSSDLLSWINRAGGSRARQAMREAVGSVGMEFVHIGALNSDLPLPVNNLHPAYLGHMVEGRMLSRAVYNLFLDTGGQGDFDASGGVFPAAQAGQHWTVTTGGTIDGLVLAVNDVVMCTADVADTTASSDYWRIVDTSERYSLGPEATGVTPSGDRKEITVAVSAGSHNLVIPAGGAPSFNSPSVYGGAPWGALVLKPDDTPIQIVSGQWSGDNLVLVLAETAPAGSTFHFHAGFYPEFREFHHPTDDQLDPFMNRSGCAVQDCAIAF